MGEGEDAKKMLLSLSLFANNVLLLLFLSHVNGSSYFHRAKRIEDSTTYEHLGFSGGCSAELE